MTNTFWTALATSTLAAIITRFPRILEGTRKELPYEKNSDADR